MRRWIAFIFLGIAITSRIGALHSSFLNEKSSDISQKISKFTHHPSAPSVILPEETNEKIRLTPTRRPSKERSQNSESPAESLPRSLPKETEIYLREAKKEDELLDKFI